MKQLTKITLKKQFLIVSFLILVIGMMLVGFIVSSLIETGVIYQTARVTALYVESFVSPLLQDAKLLTYQDGQIHPSDDQYLSGLSTLLIDTPLGQNIASFKIWLPDGEIIYSTNSVLIGSHFTIREQLEQALNGEIVSERTNLDDFEHIYEKQKWDELIEIYSPIKSEDTGEIIAVAEFYLFPDALNAEISNAQLKSWAIVGISTLLMYFILAKFVERSSKTINLQQDELLDNVQQLQDILSQNEVLNKRIQRAASRTTLLNEQFLSSISADLHDGPIQDLALALLRIYPLSDEVLAKPSGNKKNTRIEEDFQTIQNSLESAIQEIRQLSSGLLLPNIENKSFTEVCKRVIREYEKKTNRKVDFNIRVNLKKKPMPITITTYRVIQEALMNGFHHAKEANQKVTIIDEDDILNIDITDSGPGFDTNAFFSNQKLGLSGMRERVEVLGGEFIIESSKEKGTSVKARIPITDI